MFQKTIVRRLWVEQRNEDEIGHKRAMTEQDLIQGRARRRQGEYIWTKVNHDTRSYILTKTEHRN